MLVNKTLTAGIDGCWSASDELGLVLLSKSLLETESSGSDFVIGSRFSLIVVGNECTVGFMGLGCLEYVSAKSSLIYTILSNAIVYHAPPVAMKV